MPLKPSAHPSLDIQPLQNGDHLTREEFERRYQAMPDVKKAELVEGVVYMPSPVRLNRHAYPHGLVVAWLGAYAAGRVGVQFGVEPTVRLDLENEPQPDAILRIEGGSSRISEDDYIEGPPELIVEIAASSVSMDLHSKLKVYRRNGVQEYLVWRVEETLLTWFSLQLGEYLPLEPDSDGILKSRIFPGLWLNSSALLQGHLGEVLATVQWGLSQEGSEAR
ncbi:MAG: Uma2 family endonuclease [Thermostichus sp. HHBFW_bins_43]